MTHLGDLIDILTGIVSPTPDKDREISRLSQSKTPPAGSGYLHGLPCRGPFVPVSDQTDFGLPHTELQTEQGQPYEEDLSSGSRGSGGLSFLGGPKWSELGSPTRLCHPQPNPKDGHCQVGMGSSPGCSLTFGSLGLGWVALTRKSAGDPSSFQGRSRLGSLSTEMCHPAADRQHYGHALYQQDGRDQTSISGLSSSSDHSLVSGSRHHSSTSASFRSRQCHCRSPISTVVRTVTLPGKVTRVVSLSRHNSLPSSTFWETLQLICLLPEQTRRLHASTVEPRIPRLVRATFFKPIGPWSFSIFILPFPCYT